MEYSKTHCHFCKKKLELAIGSSSCPDIRCNINYRYSVNDERISFTIDKYWFQICRDNSMIIAGSDALLTSNISLEINTENYLEQIDRINKLQAFN